MKVYVWDRVVRITHVVFIIGIVSAYVSYQLDRLTWHMWNGYAVLAAVLFRIVWGFIAPGEARFSRFLKGFGTAWRYVSTWRRQPVPLGHNPLGGYAVLALLATLVTQAGTGLFATDDIMTEGPLYSSVSNSVSSMLTGVHQLNFWFVLLPLVALHVAAIVFYRVIKKADLVTPMISGYKNPD